MDKIILKIEEIFNLVAEKILLALKYMAKAITPGKAKEFYTDTKINIQQTIEEKKSHTRQKFLRAKKKVTDRVDQVKSIDYKTKVEETKKDVLEKVEKTKSEAKTLNKQKVSAGLLAFLLFPYKKISGFFASLSPAQIVSGASFVALSLMGSLAIYESGKSMYNDSEIAKRKPAAIAPKLVAGNRPAYYNTDKKSFKISSIRVPIYWEKPTDIQVLIIDVTIKADTQFLTKFIKAKEHIFRDILLSKMEPIVPAFTLEKEGKRVIREVVMRELNLFLKDKTYKGEPVQGKVVGVYIDYIMGS